MEKSSEMGGNRTGMDVSPLMAKEMLTGMDQYEPSPGDANLAFAALGEQYISPDNSVGSMPPPGTMKGALKTMSKKLVGRNPEMFLNKLGERLAYERSGVRLYEAFIRKCEALQNGAVGTMAPLEELWEIRNEEEEHFLMLQECMIKMGADPTAQTPDADVSGVASMGIMQVLTDPRTSFSQCLEALLSIELIDNAAWELLIALSAEMKLDDMTEMFRVALQQEENHLLRVRTWYEDAVTSQLLMGKVGVQ
jgi:hypothetical protein